MEHFGKLRGQAEQNATHHPALPQPGTNHVEGLSDEIAYYRWPSCSLRARLGSRVAPAKRRRSIKAASARWVRRHLPSGWLQFGGDSRHGNNNTMESTITAQNVGQLTKLFQVSLPETIEGAPVVLTNVSTSSGVHDVAYMTTRSGYIVAMDAYTGQTLWSAEPANMNITMSSPAIDPALTYVYSAGLDGYIHKYAVGTGAEVTTGGWPELSTSKISVEKDGTAITIGTSGGTNYLYMGVGGYDGDGGDYEGHVTTINLQTGAQFVFAAMCSNRRSLRPAALPTVPRNSPASLGEEAGGSSSTRRPTASTPARGKWHLRSRVKVLGRRLLKPALGHGQRRQSAR